MALLTARSPAEVLALRPVWEQLEWKHIEAQLDWFLADTAARDATPLVMVAMREGRPRGMLLARVERMPVLPRLRRLSWLRLKAETAVVVPDGLSGDLEARRALLGKLGADLRQGEFDALCVRALDLGGEEHATLRRVLPALRRTPGPRPRRRWLIDLPDSYEQYRATLSRNLRRSRARQARALERRHGPALELVRYPGPAAVDDLLADLETVTARSYQRAAGVGYVGGRHGPVIQAAMTLGLCRAWVLRVEGRPVAYEFGWPFAGTYFAAFTAYDGELAVQAVGAYVEQTVIADLCADPAVSVYDHGPEDFVYKQRLSNRSVQLADVWGFSGTWRGRTGWLLRSAFEIARLAVGRVRAPTQGRLRDRLRFVRTRLKTMSAAPAVARGRVTP